MTIKTKEEYIETSEILVDFVKTYDKDFSEKLQSFLIDNADISMPLLERFPEQVIDLEIWDEQYVKEIAYDNYNKEFVDRHLNEIMKSADYFFHNWREVFYKEDDEELIMRAIDMVENKYPNEDTKKPREQL